MCRALKNPLAAPLFEFVAMSRVAWQPDLYHHGESNLQYAFVPAEAISTSAQTKGKQMK
jgi:hypothetical protein